MNDKEGEEFIKKFKQLLKTDRVFHRKGGHEYFTDKEKEKK